MKTILRVLAILCILLPAAPAVITERVSVASDGSQGNNWSNSPSISADGRFIAFVSEASNLVDEDTYATVDVFVRDRQSGTIERVSVASDGSQANGRSDWLYISADGLYVAFHSWASNLVSGDTNNTCDVFVHNLADGTTERVSVSSEESQGIALSTYPSISADGRYVAFLSYASNLVDGDTNGVEDVFVRDRQSETTERVSVASDGSQGNARAWLRPSISADGRYVAFHSEASNLVSGDTNGEGDIFIRDRETRTTERVSVASDESQGNAYSYGPSISADGRYVAFYSWASNLVDGDTNDISDIFVRYRLGGTTELVSLASDESQGNDWCGSPSISADGRYVAFESGASNLVSGDTNDSGDVFVRDRLFGNTQRISVAGDGSQANGVSMDSSFSADGRYVAFASTASNLVSEDTNGYADVFVRDRGEEPPLINVYLPVVFR